MRTSFSSPIEHNNRETKNFDSLEKNYNLMTKEYEQIANINVSNNIAHFRIIKNVLILNDVIDKVNIQHVVNTFENIDGKLLLILKKNNYNFILKLLSTFYVKLCTYANYSINEHYNNIFEVTLNKNFANFPSEVKAVHENLLKNAILLLSLILAQVHSKVIPHVVTLVDYSSNADVHGYIRKIRKSEDTQLRYFYYRYINELIKSSATNSIECEKIYKLVKKEFNEKKDIIIYSAIKCLTNLFIAHPEY
ncbi:hypothetical protein PMLGA01_140016200, partial [Plasmodium malariae]